VGTDARTNGQAVPGVFRIILRYQSSCHPVMRNQWIRPACDGYAQVQVRVPICRATGLWPGVNHHAGLSESAASQEWSVEIAQRRDLIVKKTAELIASEESRVLGHCAPRLASATLN